MADILRNHAGIVFSLAASLLLSVLTALRAWHVQGRQAALVAAHEPELRFHYPLVQTWMLGIGGVFFLACAGLSAAFAAGTEPWLPLMFLGFALLGIGLWYHYSQEIVIDHEGIALRRLGREVRIAYTEVTEVVEQTRWHPMQIRAGRKQISVGEDLEGYSVFREMAHRYSLKARGMSRGQL